MNVTTAVTQEGVIPRDPERTLARRPAVWILVALFVINAALVSQEFFPSLNDIGVWDESSYIEYGREIFHGSFPAFTGNPAVAMLYAFTYLPFHSSPFWMVHSCSLGRLILLGLLWGASLVVAGELEGFAMPFIMAGLLLVSPAPVFLLGNGSDSLFAAMTGFALWQFLKFLRRRAIRHLWMCSAFLGAAALSRNEGPIVFGVFLILAFIACYRSGQLKAAAVACVVPFLGLTAGYVLLYGIVTGDFKTGDSERSYLAFEQGQGVAFAESYAGQAYYLAGQADARRLFGTPAENHNSVFRAISRNPQAYFARIIPLTKRAISDLVSGYGWYVALLLFAFAFRGVLSLLRRKAFLLLATFLLWPCYLLLFVLLVSQPSHLLMPLTVVFSLAGIGISAFAGNIQSRNERMAWLGAAGLLVIVAAARGTLPNGPLAAMLIIFCGFGVIWLTAGTRFVLKNNLAVTCLLLLALSLTLRSLNAAIPRHLGVLPDEQAAVFLKGNFPAGTRMAAWGPGKLYNAKMVPVTTADKLADLNSPEQLFNWVKTEKVQAIYVDNYLRQYQPNVWSVMQHQIGSGLSVAFQTKDDAVEVLVPSSPNDH